MTTTVSLSKRMRRGAFRFFVYGAMLIAGEVAFYTVVKVGRRLPAIFAWLFQFQWSVDARLALDHIWEVPIRTLYGQASLWMFFVYGSIAIFGIEPAYRRIKRWPFFVRGFVYMSIILAMECATGWVLLGLTGYEIWYYDDGGLTVLRYTSLAIAPMWFLVGLASEKFIEVIDSLTRYKLKLSQKPSAAKAPTQTSTIS